MITRLPVRPISTTTKSLSALLSQSKDDFYGQLQAVMNAAPTALPTESQETISLTASRVQEKSWNRSA